MDPLIASTLHSATYPCLREEETKLKEHPWNWVVATELTWERELRLDPRFSVPKLLSYVLISSHLLFKNLCVCACSVYACVHACLPYVCMVKPTCAKVNTDLGTHQHVCGGWRTTSDLRSHLSPGLRRLLYFLLSFNTVCAGVAWLWTSKDSLVSPNSRSHRWSSGIIDMCYVPSLHGF